MPILEESWSGVLELTPNSFAMQQGLLLLFVLPPSVDYGVADEESNWIGGENCDVMQEIKTLKWNYNYPKWVDVGMIVLFTMTYILLYVLILALKS